MSAPSAAPGPWDLVRASTQIGGAVAIPLLAFWSTNAAIGPDLGTLTTLWVALTCLGVIATSVAARVSRGAVWPTADVATIGVLAVFNWRALGGWTRPPLSMRPIDHALACVIALLLVLLAIRFGASDRMRRALAVALTVAAATSGLQVALAVGGRTAEVTQASDQRLDAGPDVWFIVPDAYARGDVLRRIYDADNDEFVDALTRRGFRVAPRATAAYSMTMASVGSALAMELPIEPEMPVGDAEARALYAILRGENPVVRSLKAAGYEYVHAASSWAGMPCSDEADRCLPATNVSQTLTGLLDDSAIAPAIKGTVHHRAARAELDRFQSLTSLAGEPRERPRFVLAHLMVPHPPMYLTEDCSIAMGPHRSGNNLGAPPFEEFLTERKATYVGQVACVNEQLLQLVDAIDHEAIVVIASDHGPDSRGQLWRPVTTWDERDVYERHSTLAAYRLPGRCAQPPDDVSMANTFRIVLACLGAPIEPIDTRTILFKPGESTLEFAA